VIKEIFYSYQELDTMKWATDYAITIHPGTVVCLEGDIGAGKTVLARGIAHGMGIDSVISSPTFTLVNSYSGTDRYGKGFDLHHFDLYRINDAEELLDIGWDEYFNDHSVCLIEWSERAGNFLPVKMDTIHIERDAVNDMARMITLHQERE